MIQTSLNTTEKNILGLWFLGCTAKESAKLLNKSNRTIEYYRDRIKIKAGVCKFAELYQITLKNGEFPLIIEHAQSFIL